MNAIIFFGHGARDVRWREPFDRLVSLWSESHPEVPVSLAFLELMQPSLSDACKQLASLGATSIQVIPVFFGQGGHLRNDFPLLLEECRQQNPQVNLSASQAVGEDDLVLKAIIDFASKNR